MLIPCARTYPLKQADASLEAALFALGLQAKNTNHTARFLVRNILSAYNKNALKDNLRPNQLQALRLANAAVKPINSRRREKPNAKLLKPFDDKANPWQILNVTLLDTLTRTHPNQGINPYTALPATIAQAMVNQTIKEFQSYAKALHAYLRDPKKFTGRPKLPNYGDKNDRATFQIPFAAISTKGKLPKIGKKQIATDYEENQFLGDTEKTAYHAWELNPEIETIRKKLKLPADAKPAILRISFRKGKPKAAIVFTYSQEVPNDSIMAQVMVSVQKNNLDDNEKLVEVLKTFTTEQINKFASLDLGLNNFLSWHFQMDRPKTKCSATIGLS